jgi:hypothetical protein
MLMVRSSTPRAPPPPRAAGMHMHAARWGARTGAGVPVYVDRVLAACDGVRTVDSTVFGRRAGAYRRAASLRYLSPALPVRTPSLTPAS